MSRNQCIVYYLFTVPPLNNTFHSIYLLKLMFKLAVRLQNPQQCTQLPITESSIVAIAPPWTCLKRSYSEKAKLPGYTTRINITITLEGLMIISQTSVVKLFQIYMSKNYYIFKTNIIYIYKSKYKKVGVLPMRIVWSNVSSIGPSSERNRK